MLAEQTYLIHRNNYKARNKHHKLKQIMTDRMIPKSLISICMVICNEISNLLV